MHPEVVAGRRRDMQGVAGSRRHFPERAVAAVQHDSSGGVFAETAGGPQCRQERAPLTHHHGSRAAVELAQEPAPDVAGQPERLQPLVEQRGVEKGWGAATRSAGFVLAHVLLAVVPVVAQAARSPHSMPAIGYLTSKN